MPAPLPSMIETVATSSAVMTSWLSRLLKTCFLTAASSALSLNTATGFGGGAGLVSAAGLAGAGAGLAGAGAGLAGAGAGVTGLAGVTVGLAGAGGVAGLAGVVTAAGTAGLAAAGVGAAGVGAAAGLTNAAFAGAGAVGLVSCAERPLTDKKRIKERLSFMSESRGLKTKS